MPMASSTLPRTMGPARRAPRNVPTAVRGADEALDQEMIAHLSTQQIVRMTQPELARVVRSCRLPGSGRVRLEQLDRTALERLTHQARLACRNRADDGAARD